LPCYIWLILAINFCIKLLTGLIDLFKDIIEGKLSLKVNWEKTERIN
jgi:hypothetical protein